MAIVIDILLAPLLLCAVPWVRRREAAILCDGMPLTAEQIVLARAVGVAAPEQLRVLFTLTMPVPLPRWLQRAAEFLGWLPPHIAGMTFGYGIVLRSDCRDDRRLLAHELAHVAQYERFGRYGGFLRPYLRECVWPGYPHGPLEIESRRAEALVADKSALLTQDSENMLPYAGVKTDGSGSRGQVNFQVNQ